MKQDISKTMEDLVQAANLLGQAMCQAPWPKKQAWQGNGKRPKPSIKKALS